MPFERATKYQSKLRLALCGIAGSGKTYTALSIATHMAGDKRIAVIDTERGSARKYSDDFDFDVQELTSFSPDHYIAAIADAEAADYGVLIIDSLSHAWMGRDGILEIKDRIDKAKPNSNGFTNWRSVTPQHNALIDTILDTRLHIIATMRAKMAYAVTQNENGKTKVEKLGMEPIQRDGLDFEFDVVGDLNETNDLIIGKTRCSALKGRVFNEAGADVAAILNDWLATGITPPERAWNKREQQEFWDYWTGEELAMTRTDIFQTLGIQKGLGEWRLSIESANDRMRAYINQSANGAAE